MTADRPAAGAGDDTTAPDYRDISGLRRWLEDGPVDGEVLPIRSVLWRLNATPVAPAVPAAPLGELGVRFRRIAQQHAAVTGENDHDAAIRTGIRRAYEHAADELVAALRAARGETT